MAVAIAMFAAPARVVLAADEAGAPPKHPDDPVAAEARRHYEEGTKAYNLGEYPRAIAEFKAAYNAKPDPLLLYNIAQSFRLGGDAAQALFFYRSFLRNMPEASNRKEVEGRIRTLEKQVEKQGEEQKKEAPAPVVVPPPSAVAPAPLPSQPPPVAAAPSPARTPAQPPVTPVPPAPPPTAVAPTPAPQSTTVDLTQPASEEPTPSSPFYKRWWFWTGIGALLVIGIAAKSHDKAPESTLGSYDPTFVKPLGGGL